MLYLDFPSPLHRVALADALRDLQAGDNVIGVILVGSLARGNARPDSDIDLIVVHERGERSGGRRAYGNIEVEFIARTAESWTEQFCPSAAGDESWGYAFLEGVILHDPRGIAAQLREQAGKSHAGYHVPGEIVEHFVSLWKHVLPKLRDVLRGGDNVEIGWSAAVMTHPVIQTLWAANDLPLPSLDIGCLQRRLDDITVPANAPQSVREMVQASPQRALELQVSLLEAVVPLLEDQLK
jgi:hypothetical protein